MSNVGRRTVETSLAIRVLEFHHDNHRVIVNFAASKTGRKRYRTDASRPSGHVMHVSFVF